jgi:hypothetical protein
MANLIVCLGVKLRDVMLMSSAWYHLQVARHRHKKMGVKR